MVCGASKRMLTGVSPKLSWEKIAFTPASSIVIAPALATAGPRGLRVP